VLISERDASLARHVYHQFVTTVRYAWLNPALPLPSVLDELSFPLPRLFISLVFSETNAHFSLLKAAVVLLPWVYVPPCGREGGLGNVAPRNRGRTAFRRRKVFHSGERRNKFDTSRWRCFPL
jgi:hypothetical protein